MGGEQHTVLTLVYAKELRDMDSHRTDVISSKLIVPPHIEGAEVCDNRSPGTTPRIVAGCIQQHLDQDPIHAYPLGFDRCMGIELPAIMHGIFELSYAGVGGCVAAHTSGQ